MHSTRRFDIDELRQEAQKRWLKPSEILFILQNYDKDQLTLAPPQNPPSGSLFLFNRRVLRFFRKDGYSWHKKKDGKTVGEAHERLKVDNIDALNCYYAHGDQNPNFQRRSYWILDPAYNHIVLVHYRDVTKDRKNVGSLSNLSTTSNSTFSPSASFCNDRNAGSSGISGLHDQYRITVGMGYVEEVSSCLAERSSEMDCINGLGRSGGLGNSSESEVSLGLRRLTEHLSLDSEDDYLAEELPCCSQNENLLEPGFLASEREESFHDALTDLPLELLYEEPNLSLDMNFGMQDELKRMPLLQNSGNIRKKHSQVPGSEYAITRQESPSWKEMLEYCTSSIENDMQDKNLDEVILDDLPNLAFNAKKSCEAKDMTSNLSANLVRDECQTSAESTKVSVTLAEQPEDLRPSQDYLGNENENKTNSHVTSESDFSIHLSAAETFLLGSENPIHSPTSSEFFQEIEKSTISTHSSGTSTLDASSVGGVLTKTNSIDWLHTANMMADNHKYSPDYYGVSFDQESSLENPLGIHSSLTVAQVQCFSIREISPEWAYSTEGSKVVITGDFLCDSSKSVWACMFGEIEVPAEVIQAGVLRCHAPPHVAGKVNFCITSGNREACSEIREFEYRIKPESSNFDYNFLHADATKSSKELLLLVRFAEMLLLGHDSVSVEKVDSAESVVELSRKPKLAHDAWREITQELSIGSDVPCCIEIIDWLLQELFKDKLQQWLSSKCQEGEANGCPLSKHEQGIIHMISGLGYEWALNSVLKSGIGINFRDVNGWTALHWASRFGREKMVAALVAAGASAGAVTDPTPQDPVGKTAASIADAYGYKGLAGYLSEVALTSHLSSLTLEEREISKTSAAVEAESALESIAEKTAHGPVGQVEDQLSLKDSLAAVRNSAQAASRILAAFRAHSFRKRQLRALTSCEENGWTLKDIHELSGAAKYQWAFCKLHNLKMNKAAVSIQKKFRGWKRRKEYLKLRKNVVKIQAHVRGHQVRKKYKEFLWTVGVLEKVILRWRRKGVGLRGFQAELESMDETEDDDILKVFRKLKVDAVIEQAMSRVLSMVESSQARHQYRRMLENYRLAKTERINNTSDTASISRASDDIMEKDDVDMMCHLE